MATSTNAILCYGVRLPEHFVEEFREPDSEVEAEREQERNPLGFMAYIGIRPEIDGVRVMLVRHQSSEHPRYFAAIANTELTAWRGHPKIITVDTLCVAPGWRSVLRKFCEQHNIPWKEPQWWIASDWS